MRRGRTRAVSEGDPRHEWGEVSEERDPRERDRRSLRSSLRFITCFPSVSRS